MKVKFTHDNNANVYSSYSEVFDTQKEFGYSDKEWIELSEERKMELLREWALPNFEYWYEEIEE